MAAKKHIKHKIFSLGVLCFLCLFVAAEPFRVANASLNTASTMPCCVGKTAGHCESGIAAKKVPPPKSEPMCGSHGAEMETDGITIVAEPIAESSHSHSQTAETNSSYPGAESNALSQPCRMDCASCAASATRQQKRESIVQPNRQQNSSVTTASLYEEQVLLFSSDENSEQASPRGPPSISAE
ncbi:MAG TPA: hypothetical protein VK868_06685 [Pyrinomonadaceae bacterium]|nr:hypothetical protein [Pyrinomonadaceae bacterium]